MLQRIDSTTGPWPLYDGARSRAMESQALAAATGGSLVVTLPSHPSLSDVGNVPVQPSALMASAGHSLARLALALAPRGRRAWVASGPGNNGGDGLVAARHLHAAGWSVLVSLIGDPQRLPADAAAALEQARQAGVSIQGALPERARADVHIDALLGLGARRPAAGAMAAAIERLNAVLEDPVLAVDLPSGLQADTGCTGGSAVHATDTLALLTLKPGLFTAEGRDHAGRVWFDDLGWSAPAAGSASVPSAWLAGPPAWPLPAHALHKGSFGDVLVIGGAAGMGGAALLAARAALTAGAGRVMLARLDGDDDHDTQRPELMPRSITAALDPVQLASATVVAGCGGGAAIAEHLPEPLCHAPRLVLDADALNALSRDPALQAALVARASRGQATIVTPHPLEAARLMGISVAEVQQDRLHAANSLARQLQSVVVLKGSGSVIAAPEASPIINPTGTARLATAGSGDVLAGWLGGAWSRQQRLTLTATDVAQQTVWLHGRAGESGDPRLPLRAGDLIDQMAASLARR